ncbi:MAG: hypothetical protein NVSMB26_23700 [Beijerinckiaceae bacterium]
MRGLAGLFSDARGISASRMAIIASGLALTSLAAVQLLDWTIATGLDERIATNPAELSRLARTIRVERGGLIGLRASGVPVDYTATGTSAPRGAALACKNGGHTVTKIAPAGGPAAILDVCDPATSGRE